MDGDADDDSSLKSVNLNNTDGGEKEFLLSSKAQSSTRQKRERMKKLLIFISLWTVYLIISAAYSIISPFYPQEAAKFGVGSLGVGLIVGASPLCVVILSPIFGYFIPEIGLKFMLVAGCFLVGGAFVLLGYLIDMSTDFQFILFSVLLRVAEGVGSAGYSTSSFTMATVLYPESTGTVMGILEVGSGIGFVIGPPLGGLLYKVGGFVLPFVVTGGLVLLFVPAFMMFLPDARGEKQFIRPKTLLKLHSDIPFLLLGLDNIIMIAALGFFTPTLAPFLIEQFHLSELGVGLVFLCCPLLYMLSSFLAGKWSDLMGPRYLIVSGFIIAGVSYFFIGPAEFISTCHLWLTCVALCITGVGLGLGLVPIYPDMLEIARRMDPATSFEVMSGIVSGLCSSTLCLGEFIGPIVSGALTEVLSFQMAAMIFGQVLIAKALLLLGVTLIDRFHQRTHSNSLASVNA